jgi:Icc-related predicted phosphoesterase
MTTPLDTVRIAALGDLHCDKNAQGTLSALFSAITEQADVMVMCGDLTDYGTADEARVLAKELSVVRIPMVAVLGNHDFESGKPEDVTAILSDAGVRVLDGDACEVHGVGFAGVKGFCGGFGPRTLAPWGEEIVKRFVHEALDEALKLESALARLRTPSRIAVLHYAPVQATVEGEPCEIFPFLGSSRLEEPLMRYPVTVVVHGHAHHGQPEGHTRTGVPVYNVTRALLERTQPDRTGFRILEVSRAVPRETAPQVLDRVTHG